VTDVELIEAAVSAMRRDPDPCWRAVAELLAGGPLGYARLIAVNPNPARVAANYPDAARGVQVARAYLEGR
jgi:hypothetical protein